MTNGDNPRPDSPDLDVVIVGAGFAGLYAIHLLREHGFTCHAFDAAGGIGGTWYWNRYPGARCDVESVDYCYSFSETIHQEWSWTERFATQPEILEYAEFVADRLDLRRDISLNSQVTSMVWDDSDATWTTTLRDGRTTRSRFVITAVGLLSSANLPDISGLDRFAGRTLHTGSWPHEPVDFSGRRVAVIGTGSSGIQVIPEVARAAEQLTVLQRTANYSLPAHNRPLTGREAARAKQDREFIREQAEITPAGYYSAIGERSVFDDSPARRREVLEHKWQVGGTEFLTAYHDTVRSREANELVAEFVREKVHEIVDDPATAAILEPDDHPIASKRPTVGSDYYETFNLPHVQVVDLKVDPIVEIDETAVRTQGGTYEIDDLILATGYDAITGPLRRLGIRGRDGVDLADTWQEGPRSYLGLATAGFPNLFTVTGPLSATALTNVLRSIEHHVEWIVDCMDDMRRHGRTTIEATEPAQDQWDAQVAEIGGYTFYPEVASWYTGGNIDGKPRKLMMWVGGFDTYRQACSTVAENDYQGFAFDARQTGDALAAAGRPGATGGS